jgi:hypothetical protein
MLRSQANLTKLMYYSSCMFLLAKRPRDDKTDMVETCNRPFCNEVLIRAVLEGAFFSIQVIHKSQN